MSTLKSNVIEPATGTNLTLGASGDLIDVTSDILQLNTWKDSGGNTLFVSDGSGNLSSVNSGLARGGGPNLILSQTASGSSSLSFTSGIDSTYYKYMFVLTDINPAEDDRRLLFQGSIDGGSNYNITITSTNFRAYNYESGGTPALQYDTGSDQSQGTSYQKFTGTCGNGSDECIAGILYLFTPSSTTYVKHFYGTTNTHKQDNVSDVVYLSGYFNDGSNDIDAISFKMDSGNFDGTIKMYGCN